MSGVLAFFIGTKLRAIFTSIGAVLLLPAIAFGAAQTVRIEGWSCEEGKGGRPDCFFTGFKQRVASIRIDLDHVRDLRAAERAGYERAQESAKQLATTRKQLREANDQLEAERKNNELSKSRSAARAAAARYAAANRVRVPCPAGAAIDDLRSGGTDLPEGTDTTVIFNGRRCDSGMVAVSRGDFDTLVDNTVRLANAHDWAIDLAAQQP